MFEKRKKRKLALEALRKLIKESNGLLNPVKHAFKQQQLLGLIGTLVIDLLDKKL